MEGDIPLIPFVFSAASDKSLEAVIRSYFSYLKETPSIDLRRLAYTLVCNTVLFSLDMLSIKLRKTNNEISIELSQVCSSCQSDLLGLYRI